VDKKLIDDISQIIRAFNESLQEHLPALENEAAFLIESKSKDCHRIESTLDILLSMTSDGLAVDLFLKLLEYYKTVDSEGALYYWNEYKTIE
jgi:hypothetical protein